MVTIFMNLENSKTSMSHVLKLKLTSKLDLRIGKKFIIKPEYLLHMEKYKEFIQ